MRASSFRGKGRVGPGYSSIKKAFKKEDEKLLAEPKGPKDSCTEAELKALTRDLEEAKEVLERIRVDVTRKENAVRVYEEQLSDLEADRRQEALVWRDHLKKLEDPDFEGEVGEQELSDEVEALKEEVVTLEKNVMELKLWKERALQLQQEIAQLKEWKEAAEKKKAERQCLNCFCFSSPMPIHEEIWRKI